MARTPGDDGPPLVLEHTCGHRLLEHTCGYRLAAQVVCEAYGQPVRARDTRPAQVAAQGRPAAFPGLRRPGRADLPPAPVAHKVKTHRRGVEQFGSSLGS